MPKSFGPSLRTVCNTERLYIYLLINIKYNIT